MFQWGYREARAVRHEPLRAPAPSNDDIEHMHIAGKIILVAAFVLAMFVIVYGCMAAL
jgi:hypothetical protein